MREETKNIKENARRALQHAVEHRSPVWLVLQKVADSLFVSHQVVPKPLAGALSLHTGAGASPHRVAALASASQSFLQAFFTFLH